MKKHLGDNLSKFFYDCGKVSFTLFIAGGLTKKPFVFLDLVGGTAFTLILLAIAVTINLVQELKL